MIKFTYSEKSKHCDHSCVGPVIAVKHNRKKLVYNSFAIDLYQGDSKTFVINIRSIYRKYDTTKIYTFIKTMNDIMGTVIKR